MSNYISQNELTTLYNREKKRIKDKSIIDKFHTNKDENKRNIFLSHSHLDKTIIDKILLIFDKLNIDLYIDWKDEDMPEFTDKNTAIKIKNKIKLCKKFIFLATQRSLKSRWCNWEIGIADNTNQKNCIAIIPIESSKGNWDGNEYLQLYPEIVFENDIEKISLETTYIRHDNISISFKDWINQY